VTRSVSFGVRRTVVATAVVTLAVALAGGALILRSQLRSALEQAIEEQTLTRAEGVAALAETEDFSTVLEPTDRTPAWVQIIDADGVVVASTPNIRRLKSAFASLPVSPSQGATVRRMQGLRIDTGERVAVASVTVVTKRRVLTVLAASPLDLADVTDRRMLRSLALVFPLLLVIAAGVVWVATRRALRPVEAIRSEVASITTTDLGRRVPVPGGRDEISRLALTMNDMLERLDSAVSRQRRFVADASHELRSPLASLRNQLEASLVGRDDLEWTSMVDELSIDRDRMERLVVDLLLLARRDEGERLRLEPVDVGYLVRSELARRPAASGLERVVDAENVLVDGNADALVRVLRNLVDNAERHAHSKVNIAVRLVDGFAEVVVTDDGGGIPEADRESVFERFHRLDEARSGDAGGSGLGLAIVSELVAEHRGSVSVEPSTIGARFVVRIPALAAI
jgi:signal transduction histidine kinase